MAGREGPRGPYAKTAATRDRILDAAEAVFAENGFLASTVKQVAARAEISERGLVHHFPSKSELLTGVLARQEERTGADFPAQGDLRSLGALIEQQKWLEKSPNTLELQAALIAESTSPSHPAHAHFASRYEMLHQYVVTAFQSLADQGALESSLSPEDLASGFVALSDGLHLQWLFNRDKPLPSGVLQRFLESIVPGLRSATAPEEDAATP
ncbi:TetR/AcrR family transcriptional regulator [Sinomonas humi]|uniref:TetR/AcrR family transcriptional regulator n=1 Tax=Sinomonas humi TaxID=1338436 RepID=UPI00068FD64A|nr:TetR/AcrR family transcriptional regulator [Sinomonas humi]